jgi:hypothetical protein
MLDGESEPMGLLFSRYTMITRGKERGPKVGSLHSCGVLLLTCLKPGRSGVRFGYRRGQLPK